ncbi:unnamed protein product, partial [Mesorhabditis spiculigera]
MNSAIRAVVRTGLFVNCRVFYVYDGFRGLVDNRVQEATWESATSLIQKGGSVLGVAPCEEFKTREGRLKGAKTLVLHGINNLIVIGGGGSMEALQTFKQEWRSLVQELVSKGLVPDNMGRPLQDLGVCGIPCAVTNDIWGTEMTLGADSALTRVIDSVDHVEASLNSSQRVFIVEVLGKHCGFLAMTAGLAVEADFVFVPEWPPVTEWRDALTDKLQRMALLGRHLNIIIVAEGAMDNDGSPISPSVISRLIETTLKYHCQVTSLGHLQYGGVPTAFDRCLGARMGAEALLACAQRREDQKGVFVALRASLIERGHLGRAVEKTLEAEKAYRTRDYERCVQLRGSHYSQKGRFLDQTLEWGDVIGWVSEGGSALGTSRQLVSDPDRLAAHVLLHNIRGIAIIGGFEAFQSALMIRDWRDEYDSFRIPIVVVPATISAFIVEVQGENSGYLATIGAIATGADNAHIYEEKMRQEDLAADVDFSTRLNYLGHSVQGGKPSAFDRNSASRFGAKAFERMFSHSRRNTADIELLGVRFGDQAYADVGMLETLACFVHTNVRNPWWLTTHGLMRVLATQEKYMAEAIPPERSCNAKNYQTSAGQQPEFIGR